ncbi:flagellin [Rhodospirillum rubrum]|uniref:Flagellin n=1 Tax=Rhodospirillum rubrum (strain ATCC 11170 / ATH 1.1.1 / DSM 467 / LMG 4362 / NCIMB 8255 / S1) TaxID=269796 RepID=Q2RRB1_RHORT|nr:flagellin [Rhodospirillum rubrum]ABC23334.1 Flagellin-like [Rhodospirillum rubrum ATCC 11170]AEO49067.1 flagellin-like protein [Rhodospirillum rubrum F11]MBK5954977.1 flagellin [Rhodospirillum rubrum]QXG79307.1 flagellin [Rhodospirillum rubrum]HAQ01272.1 flagellin [Rhodospirillum rubrum]
MPVITTNTSANSALRYLNMNAAEQTNSLNRIASGSKINRASDDASGLAVATKLQTNVSTLNQAATNASHATSILQTADGGLSQISDILQRMKTLTAQSISGAVTNTERAYINAEYDQLVKEIDSIVASTTFNGDQLLKGTGAGYSGSFLVGTNAGTSGSTANSDIIDIKITSGTTLGDGTFNAVAGLDLETTLYKSGATTNKEDIDAAQLAATAIDKAISAVAGARADVGAQMSRFQFQAAQIASSTENLDAAQSAITDADVAKEQSNFSSAQVKTNAAIAALSQANQMPQQLLQLLR